MVVCTITITGRVQGVGFRAFVHATAAELGLKATAENLPDGSVVVEGKGERATLETLVGRLCVGPPHAKVERIEVAWHAFR